MAERRQTALGVARARFVEGLPRKAREVRASLALLAGTPDEERPREELRRRLHALYASAQVFRIEPLAAALRDALAGIDRVRDARRGFTQDELDQLATLAATLPALGRDAALEAPSIAPLSPTPLAAPAPAPVRAKPPPPPPRRAKAEAPQPHPKRKGVATIVSVLVVDDAEQQALVRAALPPDRFEMLGARDVDEALRLARSAAPDVVLADREIALAPGADLIVRLREDPLTDFVPVILLLRAGAPLDPIAVREAGADDALLKPLDPQLVLRTVERVVSLGGPAGASTLTGELTVEELAERLAEEVKRGIVEAAEKGRDVVVPVGDGTPLMAAAWSAIGRVRAHIAERSGGRVRFREGAARGGPAFVTVVGDNAASDEVPEGFTLAGRRILVADDDPAVVWFFAGLFREHGADVVETSSGGEALEAARKRRPDLVVSDVLMPGLDGFGLTRALKRDPMLADVPVILLSWKEDLLQRMRELKAGASGYLRKEAAAGQILAAVRDVLRPRALLESRLKAGGDVRGRLEDVGLATLITTTAALRPNARITVRDASSLYEVELRNGEIVDVTRTASDGGFARGPRVFESMLGTLAGRYTVADADGPVRRSIEGGVEDLIRDAMSAVAARVDAVSGKNLAKAAHVELDEARVASVVRASPEDVERIVGELRAGRGPRDLLLAGSFEPQVLEAVLSDLARQGAIVAVRGVNGEDRIALAREARERGLHPELTEHDEHGTLSWLPPRQRPSEAPLPLDDADLASLRPPPVPIEARPLSELEPPPRRREPTSDLPTLDEPFNDELGEGPEPDDEPDLEAAPWEGSTGELAALERELAEAAHAPSATAPESADARASDERAEDGSGAPGSDESEEAEDDDEGSSDAREHDGADEDEDEGDDDDGASDEGDDDEEEDAEDDDGESDAERGDGLDRERERALAATRTAAETPQAGGTAVSAPTAAPAAASSSGGAAATRPAGERGRAAPPPAPQAAPRTAEVGGMRVVAWTLVLLVLAAVGLVGWRLRGEPVEDDTTIGPVPPSAATSPPEGASPSAPDDPTETSETTETSEANEASRTDAPSEAPAVDLPAYGREEEGIADVGVEVSAGRGLLVLEPAPGATLRVRVGSRELVVDRERVGVALDPGIHHLTYARGDHQDFVWVVVRAGRTRFVPPLP